jgi:hypothetical protein
MAVIGMSKAVALVTGSLSQLIVSKDSDCGKSRRRPCSETNDVGGDLRQSL